MISVAMVAALLFAPHPPKRFRSEYDPKSYPAAAIEVLRHDPTARVFTNDEWGDYLIWCYCWSNRGNHRMSRQSEYPKKEKGKEKK